MTWLGGTCPVLAGSSTWLGTASTDWNDSQNWTLGTVPSIATDTATFSSLGGAQLTPTISGTIGTPRIILLDSMVFDATSPSYNVQVDGKYAGLNFYGAGITNNSGVTQTITANNTIDFGTSNPNPSVNGDYRVNFFNTSSAGNATLVSTNDGRFVFRDSSTAGNATIHIINGIVAITDSAQGGTAHITADAGGKLDIYHGAPFVTVGSIAGAGEFGMSNNTLITGADNTSTTVSGKITDYGQGGTFSKIGTGTLTLTGTGDYKGNTNIDGGTLLVSGGGKITQAANVTLNFSGGTGTLTVDGTKSAVTSLGSVIVAYNGTSFLNVTNGGTLSGTGGRVGYAAGANGTATVDGAGSTWTNSGDLVIGGDGPSGILGGSIGTLNITAGGAVSDRLGTIGEATGSTGTVTVDGKGSTWTNSNTFGLPLVVGSSGAGTLNIMNAGVVTIDDGGGKPLDLKLADKAGSTGTLNIGNGGTSGTLNARNVIGGAGTAVVNFNHTDAASFDLPISGTASVKQTGSGSTTLTNADTYTGTTDVKSGILNVTGSLTGGATMTVDSGATLAGTGSITTAADHSMFINGSLSVGDLTVAAVPSVLTVTTSGAGSIVMGAGSALQMNLYLGAGLGDNSSTKGASDFLVLNGHLNATAGGTLVVGNPTHMTGFVIGDQWQLIGLKGGDIIGTLAVNDTALGLGAVGLAGVLDSSTGIFSIVDNKSQLSAQESGLQTAGAQGPAVMAGVQGMLGDINGHLFGLRAGGGEESDGSLTASLDDGVIVGQGDGPEKPMAKRVRRTRQWEVFTTVNYANISISTIRSQAGVNSQSWAPGVGIERHFSRGLTLGFAANLMETHQSYSGGLGTLDIQGVALSTYVSYVSRAFWSDLLYSFGRYDLTSARNPGFAFPVASGNTTAYTNAVQFNTGWNFRFQNNTLVTGPFVGLDYLHASVDSYSESGGGLAALAYNKRSYDSLVSRVGWSLSKQIQTDFALITPQFRLSYERQNISNNNGTSVNLINQPFTATTNGQAPGQDYMVAGMGVNFQFSPSFNMMLTYQGQFLRENMQAHYGSVRFGYKF